MFFLFKKKRILWKDLLALLFSFTKKRKKNNALSFLFNIMNQEEWEVLSFFFVGRKVMVMGGEK